MANAKSIGEATVKTALGVEVSLLAMDDGSVHVIAPAASSAWSIVSLFSGPGGTRLRMMPRQAEESADPEG